MSKVSIRLNILDNRAGNGMYLSSVIVLGIILTLGTILRFYDLGGESFWLDEVATTIESRQSVVEILTSGRMDQPPAYNLPIHFWIRIFGTSEFSLRSFSALAGTGSIALIYIVGRKLFGEEVGLLSAFLMAVSDFQILFSQEARNYSLFEFAALLSFLFFILYLGSNRKIHFVLYIVSSVFMVYTNAYGICIIAAQNLFFILQIKKYRNVISSWLISQVLILLAIIPYFSPIIFGGNGVDEVISLNLSGIVDPTFSDVIRSVYRFILPPRRYFGADMEWGNSLLVTYVFAGVFFVVGILVNVFRKGVSNWISFLGKMVNELLDVPDLKRNTLLVSCWLLCPPVLLFIISKVIMPVYEHRYVISAAPALYLLLALGIFCVRKMVPLWISIGVLMILIAPGLIHYYASDVREQWKEVAAYVEDNGEQNEVIMFAPNDSSVNTGNQQKAFDYYYQGALPSCGIGPDELTDSEVWGAFNQCIAGHERFWVIIRHTTITTTPYSRYEAFFLELNRTAFRLIDEQQFYAISAYLFEIER